MRTLRMALIGGGPGSMIGPAHRAGAAEDGLFTPVAGCFSRDGSKNAAMGAQLGLDPARVYADFQALAAAEAERPDGAEVAAIMTPNDSHRPACIACLSAGMDVICDKPLATSLADAVAIRDAARRTDRFLGVTHVYAAYAMTHEARRLVAEGAIGAVRLVHAEYLSGGRATLVEAAGDEKTRWRMDPAIAGPSSVIGDIGSHAHHLARFVTGLEVTGVSAEIRTVVPGRTGDDNATIALRLSNGATGHIWASMVAIGAGNGLRLRVIGDKGALEWAQETPDDLWLRRLEGPEQRLRKGEAWLGDAARRTVRLKMGQPEGMLECFANYYREAAHAILTRRGEPAPAPLPIAEADDGVRGMAFVEACVASAKADGRWTAPADA